MQNSNPPQVTQRIPVTHKTPMLNTLPQNEPMKTITIMNLHHHQNASYNQNTNPAHEKSIQKKNRGTQANNYYQSRT